MSGTTYLVQDVRLGSEAIVDLAVPTGAAIDQGELWRPLTSLAVHPGGVIHLGVNLVLLACIGGVAERELGRNRFVVTYLAAGFAANAVRYAVGGRTGGGASVAVFAVAGAALASRLHRSDRAPWADLAIVVAVAGGTLIAATASDNHLLALGLGGVVGRATANPSGGRHFAAIAVAMTAAGLAAMAGRSLSS